VKHAKSVERRRQRLSDIQQHLGSGKLLLMSAAIANAELGMVPDERVLHAGYAGGDLFELAAFLRCRIEEGCNAGPSLR
jgi:hypothetical protein